MTDKRYAIIHFIDGTQLTLDFPKQTEDSNVAQKLQKLLDSPCLMIEADGALITIPLTSVKYIQSHPSPSALPDFVIQGATLVN
jgi:hypothetical protein